MSRSIPPSLYQTETDEVALALLTITHADGVLRLVNNNEPIVSRGETFEVWPFELVLPEENEIQTTAVSVRIDNVDPEIWRTARRQAIAPVVKVELIVASAPDDVILTIDDLVMREAKSRAPSIDIGLMIDNVWQAGFPQDDFDPAQNPGLFAI